MENIPPYHFEKSELPQVAREHYAHAETFSYKGVLYTYGLIKPEAVPDVHDFAGMSGGKNLFVSIAAPQVLRDLALKHEIECNRLRAGEKWRCARIEEDLMTEVPEKLLPTLLTARRRTFEDLVRFYNIDPAAPLNDFHGEIAGTLLFLRRKMQQLNIEYVW